MQGRNWPALVGLAMFVLAAVFCAILIFRGLLIEVYAAAAALLVLAAGQTLFFAVTWTRAAMLGDKLGKQARAMREMAKDIESQLRRIHGLEERMNQEPAIKPEDMAAEMRSLRESVHDMQQRIEKPVPEAPPKPKPASEQLELLLEPVVEVAGGTTAHYRARLHMVNETVGEVGHAELMAQAEKGGMRAPLDIAMLKKAIPVLRRLRAKQPGRCIFVPLGTSTLVSKSDLDGIAGLLESGADVAGGIIFEIAHAQLATLSPDGIEGVARLARLGATLALSRVTIAGLDLASLRDIGVRFLDVEAGAIDAGFGIAAPWFQFAQFARAMQFQIIAGGVVTAIHAAAAERIARLAHGPYYAPPRRLRATATSEPASDRSQAA